MWVQFFPEIQNPIWMPAHVAHKVESLTYVEDVARAVLAVVERGEAVWNQAYNLAMEEEFSLANILLRMRDQLGVPEVRVHFILMIENIPILCIKYPPYAAQTLPQTKLGRFDFLKTNNEKKLHEMS